MLLVKRIKLKIDRGSEPILIRVPTLWALDRYLFWRCEDGHEWTASAANVKKGRWYPECSTGSGERIVRDIFEQMFSAPFPRAKPRWLVNTRGNRMELDGYCRELNLAFEYHGEQHYKHGRFFHQGAKSLPKRRAADARKRRLCRSKGVLLIEVPFTVSAKEMPTYIYRQIEDSGIAVHAKSPDEITVAEFLLAEQLREMQALAKKHRGKCRSTSYINNGTKLRWQCEHGH